MPLRWSRADGDVADSKADGVIKRSTVRVLAQRDRRPRVALAPALEGRRQHAERDRGHGCHLELARLEAQRAASVAPRAFGVCDGRLGLRQERLAGGGESDASGETLQQRAAELPLEALDLLRERRLGDEQSFGGARERAFVGDREQVLQLSKVHGRRRRSYRRRLSSAKDRRLCVMAHERRQSWP